METSSVVLLCILVACSVWTVQGRSFKVSIDDEEQVDISGKVKGLPGICWGCKWALNKVKKILKTNDTTEKVISTLKAVCDQIGLLKSKCRKFVNSHLGVLVEELTTTDDVRTICVNVRACKPKEFDLLFDLNDDEEFHHVKISELPWHQSED